MTNYLKESKWGQSVSYECFWELIPIDDGVDFLAKNIITNEYLTFKDFKVKIRALGTEGFQNKGLIHLICSEKVEGEE